MLLVETYLDASPHHGLGVFLRAPVTLGQPVWRLEPSLDLLLTEEQIAAVPEPARRTLLHYSFWQSRLERFVLCFDDARFINHADDPSTDGSRAVRALAAGEELTCPYGKRDLTFRAPRRLPVEAVGRMIALLGDPDPHLRLFALKSLACGREAAAPATPALARALATETGLARYYAAKALARIGKRAAPAEPQLVAALGDADPALRAWLERALAAIST